MYGNVLVIGANRGLGLEMVKQLLPVSKRVFATYRSSKGGLEALAAGDDGSKLALETCAIDDTESIAALAKKVGAEVGDAGIDLAIVNAGVACRGAPGEVNIADARKTFDTNVTGVIDAAQQITPLVLKSEQKLLILLSSILGSAKSVNDSKGAFSDVMVYSASKSAVNMVSIFFNNHFADKGLRCRAVHPGWVQTDMGGPQAPLQAPDAMKQLLDVISKTPAAGTPAELMSFDGTIIPW